MEFRSITKSLADERQIGIHLLPIDSLLHRSYKCIHVTLAMAQYSFKRSLALATFFMLPK